MTRQYWLTRHTYILTDRYMTILLDLRRELYIGVSREQTIALSGLVNGWSLPPSDSSQGDCWVANDPTELTRTFLNSKLITSDAKEAIKPETPELRPPAARLDDLRTGKDPRIHPGHIVRFLAAWLLTTITLRFFSQERAIERVRKRKRPYVCLPGSVEFESLERLIAIYDTLRTLVFTRDEKCLYDSLVLLDFLARHGYYPTLVIGVKTIPFSAHSWVQQDSFVLNGAPEDVAEFAPILIV